MCRTNELTVSGVESSPGELDTLLADNERLRRLPQLSEEQARAAASDQATPDGGAGLTGDNGLPASRPPPMKNPLGFAGECLFHLSG
jgi:hypothetical protein